MLKSYFIGSGLKISFGVTESESECNCEITCICKSEDLEVY